MDDRPFEPAARLRLRLARAAAALTVAPEAAWSEGLGAVFPAPGGWDVEWHGDPGAAPLLRRLVREANAGFRLAPPAPPAMDYDGPLFPRGDGAGSGAPRHSGAPLPA